MTPQHVQIIVKLLDILAIGLRVAPEVMQSYNSSRALLQRMIDENRNPTDAEWAAINSEIEALQNTLHE